MKAKQSSLPFRRCGAVENDELPPPGPMTTCSSSDFPKKQQARLHGEETHGWLMVGRSDLEAARLSGEDDEDRLSLDEGYDECHPSI